MKTGYFRRLQYDYGTRLGTFLVPRRVNFLPFLRTGNGQKKTPTELPTGVNLYQRKTFR